MVEQITHVNPSVKAQLDLTDRIVLVSGGGGFLGVQFAAAVAEMGALPIILDISSNIVDAAIANLQEQGFHKAEGVVANITDEVALQKVVDDIVARHGRIDVLINNAALTKYTCDADNPDRFFGPFLETETEVWDQWLKVNLTAAALTCRIVGTVMIRQGKGSIINIASESGVISPDLRIYDPNPLDGYEGVDFTLPAFYSVSKAGLIHLSKYLATSWAKHGVRVNSFSPAGVYRGHDAGFVRQLALRIPMGRMAAINEYKGCIVFMASDASSFMTGHNLIVDGGRTVW